MGIHWRVWSKRVTWSDSRFLKRLLHQNCSGIYYSYYYWRIIALQNFVVLCQTSTCISHRYTYIPSLLNLPPNSLTSHPSRLDTEGSGPKAPTCSSFSWIISLNLTFGLLTLRISPVWHLAPTSLLPTVRDGGEPSRWGHTPFPHSFLWMPYSLINMVCVLMSLEETSFSTKLQTLIPFKATSLTACQSQLSNRFPEWHSNLPSLT